MEIPSSVLTQPRGMNAPKKNFYESRFSSRGTRWNGLLVERLAVPAAHSLNYNSTVPVVGLQLGHSENRWRAGRRYYREIWRPGTTIFRRDDYPIEECTTSGWDHILVTLEKDVVAQLLGEEAAREAQYLDHVVSTDKQVAGILQAMEAEAKAGSPGGSVLSQSLSIALLAHVGDRYGRRESTRRAQGKLTPHQVHTVTNYVRANLRSDLNLEEMAKLVQLSPTYFCRAFSKATGVTPHRFVVNERVSAAMRLLRAQGGGHSSLWSELGFASRPHFSSVFRRVTTLTPSEYKRSFK